jgi:hypothetical protein
VLFDLLVDVDIVLVEDFGIVERLKNGGLDGVGEERIFVWGLEASNKRIKLLSLTKCPVEETEAAVGYLESSRLVNCTVQGKLNSLDKVESDGVLQSTVKKIC